MITYPLLPNESSIGVTAPSSGVQPELHDHLKQSIRQVEAEGFHLISGKRLGRSERQSQQTPQHVPVNLTI
ncbi:hypothetical protein [Fictibacillus terranigra]|uniref:Uncharacterized protein n=1 Tax=Fictibacillus terranigra TaxID=3058424 RepID=A0ABT8E8G5_9BACL|nr:hypothetical protein [Fictibacillus sp. CENA-BCM004]MDN4074199.1 hypothetical protein [Fictibacillus sp. CENA-BCM004]